MNDSDKGNGRIVAGVDVGAATAKAVILENSNILASSVITTGFSAAGAGEIVTNKALEKSGRCRAEPARRRVGLPRLCGVFRCDP